MTRRRTKTDLGEAATPVGEGDQDLMSAVGRGEPAALGTLYDRYGTVLFGLCLQILRNRQDAEEVLGNVFWELWRRPERYDRSRGNVLTYLVTLTRSRAIDRLRSRHGKETHEVPGDAAEHGPGAMPEPAPSPLQEALLGEKRAVVQRALERLSEEQRKAIELSFYAGLSHGEISTELNEPLGTVKSRIRSGLVRLRDSLRTHYGGGDPP